MPSRLTLPDWFCFLPRQLPSANQVLLRTNRPVLIDTGFGSDFAHTAALVAQAGVEPAELALVVNTHHHSDHVGGNSRFQREMGIPLAASRVEGELINRRDAAACDAAYLDQPIHPYHVDQLLDDGDRIDAGDVSLEVIHAPGHSPGCLALFEPTSGILIAGDTVHSNDVAWLNTVRDGMAVLDQAIDGLDRLARLPIRWLCSGHGPETDRPQEAILAARNRYESWRTRPEKIGWHAAKRALAYRLIIARGIPRDSLHDYLVGRPWLIDLAENVFATSPADFVEPLLAEMIRSQAATWRDDRLVATAPHTPPPADWEISFPFPADW